MTTTNEPDGPYKLEFIISYYNKRTSKTLHLKKKKKKRKCKNTNKMKDDQCMS
jgi:hypothetical protein